MEPIQVGNILIDDKRLAKLDQSLVVESIARENFLSGEIRLQRVCARPLILSLIAAGMIVIGGLTAMGLAYWLIYGGITGPVYTRSIMLILLLPGGLWFLREAWRQAPMLVIETRRGTRRIEFKGESTKESAAALTRAARERGYILRHVGE